MSKELVKVQFDGDELECVPRNGKVWVVVKRACEALGIDESRQRRKLKACAWACTDMMSAHDSSGREQEAFVLDLDSLPMWLANIHATKVRPELRDKLIRYQRECATVLRDHFFGQRGMQPFDASAVRALLAEHIEPLRREIALARSEYAAVKAENIQLRTAMLEVRDGTIATATKTELEFIARRVGDLSAIRRHVGASNWRAMHIRQEMSRVTRWGAAPGQRANALPSSAVPYAMGWLDLEINRFERLACELRKDIEKAQRLASAARQGSIDFTKN
jgi:hypothetical protein